jgi:hypothetical protein
MGTKDLLLAIDNGTQSLKALIFDPEGQLIAKLKKSSPLSPIIPSIPPGQSKTPKFFGRHFVVPATGFGTSNQLFAIALPAWRSPRNGAPSSMSIIMVNRFVPPCFGLINVKPMANLR